MTMELTLKSLKAEAASNETASARLRELADHSDVAVQCAAARNKRTPPDALERLSHSPEKSTRKAVAGNPNASVAVLTRLGGQFPTQLLGNPALDFMLLENPGLFSEVPEETLTAIAKREDCPPEMLGHLARGGHGKGLLMSLVQNGATPAAAIQHLLSTPIEDLSERYEVPEDSLKPLVRLAEMHVSVMPEQSAERALETFWQAIAERLLSSPTPEEGRLLHHANIPTEIKHHLIAWLILDAGAEPAVRRLVVPAPVLETIACSGDKRALNQIRKLPDCPPWLRSAGDADEARRGVMLNQAAAMGPLVDLLGSTQSHALKLVMLAHPLAQGLPAAGEILDAMANSTRHWDRWFSAGHACTRASTLGHLAADAHADVRAAVAHNPRTPPVLMSKLADDPSWNVLKAVASARHCAAEVLEGVFTASDCRSQYGWEKGQVMDALGGNPGTPASLLEALAARGVESVGSNPSAAASVLRLLFETSKASRVLLAANPLLPVDLIERALSIQG